MKPLYVIHFSLFKGGSVFSRYRFFETKKDLYKFLFYHPEIVNNCIIFKNLDIKEEDLK